MKRNRVVTRLVVWLTLRFLILEDDSNVSENEEEFKIHKNVRTF
jgi:hypothetical protein